MLGLFGGPTGRENAAGKDLNRDFPKQFDEPQRVSRSRLESGRQPETMYNKFYNLVAVITMFMFLFFRAMMRWIKNQPFVLSANLHAGAVVASYPFDDSPRHKTGFYSASPDDDVFRYF